MEGRQNLVYTQTYNHQVDVLNDPTIPVWKKDLILRKRNQSRTLFGNIKLSCPLPSSSTSLSSCGAATSTKISTAITSEEEPSALASQTGDSNREDEQPAASSSSSSTVADFHLSRSNVTCQQRNGLLEEGTVLECTSPDEQASVPREPAARNHQEPATGANMKLEVLENVQNNINITKKVKNKKVSTGGRRNSGNNKMGEEKSSKMKTNRKLSVNLPPTEMAKDSLFDSEEIKYGPGIVHKLRDRFISITLREASTAYNKRPLLPAYPMRRASSLDNMLDDAPRRGSSDAPPPSAPNTNNQAPPRYIKNSDKHRLSAPSKMDSLKRVRSMETLLNFEGKPPSSPTTPLVNEDIVIIEQSKPHIPEPEPRQRTPSGSAFSEDDLPPPDVVRQTRQKFEHAGSPGLVTARVANFKKPSLSPKPVLDPAKPGVVRSDPKPVSKVVMPNPPPLPLPQTPTLLSPTGMQTIIPLLPNKTSPVKDMGSPPEKTSSNVLQKQLPINHTPQKPDSPSLIPKASTPSPKSSSSSLIPKSPSPSLHSKSPSPVPKSPSPSLIPKTPSLMLSPKAPSTKQKSPSPPPIITSPPPIITSPLPTTNGNLEPDNDNEASTNKTISQKALENIRRNGFSFEVSPRSSPNLSHLPGSRSPSPQVISVQQKLSDKNGGEVLQKQVGVIRPIPNRSVTEKNLINSVKSEKPMNNLKTEKNVTIPAPSLGPSPPNFSKPMPANVHKVERPTPSPSPPTQLGVVKATEPSSELWSNSKRPYNEQSLSQVFDFTQRTSVPSYIENDGLVHRPMAANDEVVDGMGLGPPSPLLDVEVIGGNVLINGRSNLQKGPKTKKLRIQFDDSATATFEYPSEASLLQSGDAGGGVPVGGTPLASTPPEAMSGTTDPLRPTPGLPMLSGAGSLASYTPSKMFLSDDTFELGVTRAAAAAPEPAPSTKEQQDFLKPAEDNETVTWSSETASDLLF